MTRFAVCSFWVDRREDYPDAPDYLRLLRILDRSCVQWGLDHVVLTDSRTAPRVVAAGMTAFDTSLPRNLMRALTQSQADWLEGTAVEVDTLFVGADCLIRRDPRGHIPPADLALILRPGHKRHRINNGFMYIPKESREKVAPLFRSIADRTGERMCDDMVAVERALEPMPFECGPQRRAGLEVHFLPMGVWNAGVKTASDPADAAFVLHFRGRARKAVMIDWATRWML